MARILFSVWFRSLGTIQNTTCSVWFIIQGIIQTWPGYYSAYGSEIWPGYYSASGSGFSVLFKIRPAASGSGFRVLFKNGQGIIQRMVQYFCFCSLFWAFITAVISVRLLILYSLFPRTYDLESHLNCLLRRKSIWNVKPHFLKCLSAKGYKVKLSF